MSELQLSMLEKDCLELEQYIAEVQERGKEVLASKLSKKLAFLQAKISDRL